MDYYTKQEAKVKLAERLSNKGWKIYGFKEDESDSMTDYWSPAHWDGVAEKNGYVLVVDNHTEGGQNITRYNKSYKELSIKDRKKIEALESKTVERGATQEEENTAKQMIDRIKSKINEHNKNQDRYITVGTIPKHLPSCKGMIWHLEKNGKVICKGNSLSALSDVPDSRVFNIDTMEFTEEYKIRRYFDYKKQETITEKRQLNDRQLKGVKLMKKIIDTLEKNISDTLGNENIDTTKDNKSMVKKVVTTKKNIKELKEVNRTELKVNDVIYYRGNVKVLEVTDSYYKVVKLGSQNRGYQESKASGSVMLLEKKSFDKSIQNGYIKVYNIIDKIKQEEKEVWVKQKEIKTATEKKTTEPSFESNTNDLQVDVKFNEEKNGIELYFNNKPSEEVRNKLKANKFRWSRNNKCWYCKDTEESRKFIKDIGFFDNKSVSEEKIINTEYEKIDINDIENYTIDKSISQRENNNSMFRSKNKDHQKEIQDILRECNNVIIDVLKNNTNDYIEYKAKSFLQWYKKKLYNLYVKILTHKANNPSWMITGRGNLNISKYNKKMEQYNNMLQEYSKLEDKFNNYINNLKEKIKT